MVCHNTRSVTPEFTLMKLFSRSYANKVILMKLYILHGTTHNTQIDPHEVTTLIRCSTAGLPSAQLGFTNFMMEAEWAICVLRIRK